MRRAWLLWALALAGSAAIRSHAADRGHREPDAGFARDLARGRLEILQAARTGSPGRAPADRSPEARRIAILRYSEDCILRSVVRHMGHAFREDVPPPRVRYESGISLAEFQRAVERQWGFRPERVANVFVAARNEIFLIDDAAYYAKLGRFLDDSLAHEYVHFVQFRYRGIRLDQDAEGLESEAVAVQTWFRERHLLRAPSSGPSCPL